MVLNMIFFICIHDRKITIMRDNSSSPRTYCENVLSDKRSDITHVLAEFKANDKQYKRVV